METSGLRSGGDLGREIDGRLGAPRARPPRGRRWRSPAPPVPGPRRRTILRSGCPRRPSRVAPRRHRAHRPYPGQARPPRRCDRARRRWRHPAQATLIRDPRLSGYSRRRAQNEANAEAKWAHGWLAKRSHSLPPARPFATKITRRIRARRRVRSAELGPCGNAQTHPGTLFTVRAAGLHHDRQVGRNSTGNFSGGRAPTSAVLPVSRPKTRSHPDHWCNPNPTRARGSPCRRPRTIHARSRPSSSPAAPTPSLTTERPR